MKIYFHSIKYLHFNEECSFLAAGVNIEMKNWIIILCICFQKDKLKIGFTKNTDNILKSSFVFKAVLNFMGFLVCLRYFKAAWGVHSGMFF